MKTDLPLIESQNYKITLDNGTYALRRAYYDAADNEVGVSEPLTAADDLETLRAEVRLMNEAFDEWCCPVNEATN